MDELREFKPGGKKRIATVDGFALVNATVVLADKSEHDAILEICEDDNGEHYQTWIFLPDGELTRQGDDDFFQRLGKTDEQTYPYKYNYHELISGEDWHVGEDGWSK